MKQSQWLFILFCGVLLCGGCCLLPGASARPEVIVRRTTEAVKVDGDLSEAVWQSAPKYALVLPEKGGVGRESGTMQLACDGVYLYVAVDFVDSDVVARRKGDGELLFLYGDTAEVFVKPLHGEGYYELYVTPNGYRTGMFFESRSYARMAGSTDHGNALPGLRVGAKVSGTLNNYSDHDARWTGEMAIPLAEIAKGTGVPFNGREPWTILVARYNYSYHLPDYELTAHPFLSIEAFHLPAEYALMKLED